MSMDFIKRPLWTRKLSDDKLRKYLDEINQCKLHNSVASELIQDTIDCWYSKVSKEIGMKSLFVDIYKEAAYRWYTQKEQDI